jgi:hypothetical protein
MALSPSSTVSKSLQMHGTIGSVLVLDPHIQIPAWRGQDDVRQENCAARH